MGGGQIHFGYVSLRTIRTSHKNAKAILYIFWKYTVFDWIIFIWNIWRFQCSHPPIHIRLPSSFVHLSIVELVRFATENETPLKSYVGSQLIITLDKPEDVKAILMSPNCLDKPWLYDLFPLPQSILIERCKQFFEIFF